MFVLKSADTPVPRTGRTTAVVTIVIGDNYEATWRRLSAESWLRYTETFGYDLIVIACPLDTSARAQSRSPAWQKLLILNQPWSQNYERIVWLDSDIIIGPNAQSIIQAAGPAEKVGLTVAGGRISDSERMLFIERLYESRFVPTAEQLVWEQEVRKNYTDHGVTLHETMFNTGVLVLSPKHHNDLLLYCYEGEQVSRLYEQPLLSHEIIVRDLAHLISTRFNWGIQEALFLYVPEIINLKNRPMELRAPVLRMARYLVRRELMNAYFLHFYGSMGLMMTLTHEDVFGGSPLDVLRDEAAT